MCSGLLGGEQKQKSHFGSPLTLGSSRYDKKLAAQQMQNE